MHPIFARRGGLPSYFAAWLPLAALLVGLLGLAASWPWGAATAVGLPLTLAHAALGLSAFYVCRANPVRPDAALRPAAGVALAAAVSSALLLLPGWGWALLLGRLSFFTALPERYRQALPLLFAVGVLFYLLAAAAHYLLLAVEAVRAAETRALEQRALAREAELKALRAQVDPHFLFNSLNTVASLAGSDPQAARRVTLRLAELLRRGLRLAERETVPLAEELAWVRSYLEVEKARFGNRLRLAERVDPAAETVPVPPGILQPLVENAVKHGIAHLVDGGEILVEATPRGDGAVVAVESSCDPGRPARGGEGIGLANVRRRLAATYGAAASLAVHAEPERFRVELRLPGGRLSSQT